MNYEPILETINAVITDWWRDLDIDDKQPESASLHCYETRTNPAGKLIAELDFRIYLPTTLMQNRTYPPPEQPEVWSRLAELDRRLRANPTLDTIRFAAYRHGLSRQVNYLVRMPVNPETR